jgi:hypothetical protein|tara:strand:+ start:437 stop:1648 length:1212 start_codon:yes stop_codon:yes gene_type:complete
MSSYYKFKKNDKIINYITSYPYYKFSIYDASVYLNDQRSYTGSFTDQVGEVPPGFISLYELNVDRDFSTHTFDPEVDSGVKARIFPFITKDSSLNSFGTVTSTDWNQFAYGTVLTGNYPLSASITREGFAEGVASRPHITALKNTLNYYSPISPHYQFSSSLGNKAQQRCNLISVPSIFFGKQIQKGSVRLDFYISGSSIATLEDVYKNGTLIQTSGTTYAQSQGSGSVAGVVLYNEGFMVLTGAWSLDVATYDMGSTTETPKWVNFAVGCNDEFTTTNITPSASFDVRFRGTTVTPNLTLFAHANKNSLNYSSNPTFINKTTKPSIPFTFTSSSFTEPDNIKFKNTVSSSFSTYSGSFKKQTFISKMGIYDSNKNLIAIVNLARPVRKKESDEYTFKINLDI